jgi:hypothetical protein
MHSATDRSIVLPRYYMNIVLLHTSLVKVLFDSMRSIQLE